MVMENGFSSPRAELFPAGLRVLVVDDDPTWLKILEKMLKKCSYEVTTSGLAREALRLLRDRKDGFDIVISDVNMPDMDGFKLLEHVGLEMDLPVIMMSVDGETSRVMKGVQHGACDYLLKPIRMKELKNIWQHVVRKRLHEVRDIEFIDDSHSNDGHFGGDQTLLKKRKDVDNKYDEKDSSDPSSKKARVVWTVELHQKFVKAVNQIGIDSDKVGPKRILDLMNVPWLTRENVASHLQKYRLYLSRIGKGDENLESSFGGTKNADYSPKESGSISLQHSGFGQQNDVTSNHLFSGSQLPVQSTECKPIDRNLKSKTEPRKPFNNENSDPQRANNSQAGLSQTFRSLETSTPYASLDSPVSARYPWGEEVLDLQFKPELKPQPKLRNSSNQTVLPILQQQIPIDVLEPASHICSAPSISESDNFSLIDIKPPIGNSIRQPSPLESALGPLPVINPDPFGCLFDLPLNMKNQNCSQTNSLKKQPPLEGTVVSLHTESHPSAPHGLEEVKLDMKNQNSTSQASIVDQSSVHYPETESRNQALGTESTFGLLSEDLMFRWLQGGDGPSKDFRIDDAGFSDSNFPEHVDEVSFPPYVPKFGLEYEYPFDWVEYPVVDQGLLFS